MSESETSESENKTSDKMQHPRIDNRYQLCYETAVFTINKFGMALLSVVVFAVVHYISIEPNQNEEMKRDAVTLEMVKRLGEITSTLERTQSSVERTTNTQQFTTDTLVRAFGTLDEKQRDSDVIHKTN